MTDLSDVQSGLEGVVAFATTIAEPDRAGGALRYRGVDIEDLVGVVPYEQVWGLLVDGTLAPEDRTVVIGGVTLRHATVCPHLGGPLDGPVVDGCVTCPWHGYRFDVRTGCSADGRRLSLR